MRIEDKTPARAGFTLLELLIVLVVLALVACLAIPAWFARSEITLDNAAKLLARDLREVQSIAAIKQETVRIEFLGDRDGYRVLDSSGQPLPSPSGPGSFERRYARDAIFEGVEIGRADFEGSPSLHFDENGFAQQQGTVMLLFGGDALIVHVAKPSGRVLIEGVVEAYLEDRR